MRLPGFQVSTLNRYSDRSMVRAAAVKSSCRVSICECSLRVGVQQFLKFACQTLREQVSMKHLIAGNRHVAVPLTLHLSVKEVDMIHHSCDRCQKMIDNDVEMRYVVWIEVQAAIDPAAADEDEDNLLDLDEILERLESDDSGDVSQDIYRRQRFDLCADCHRFFTQNPLGQESKTLVQFSKN